MVMRVKPNIKEAKMHLARLRHLVANKKTVLHDMNEEEVIDSIRKTRSEIWDKKLVTRS